MKTIVVMETQFFFACVLAGFFIAFLYDLLRISRRIVPQGVIAVNTEDIIFALVAATILFYAAYEKNSGEIRWHMFAGGIFGAAIYVTVIRNRLVNLSTVIVKWLVWVFKGIMLIVLFPARLVLKIFRKPIAIVAWYSGKGMRKIKGVANQKRARMRIRVKNICSLLRKNRINP